MAFIFINQKKAGDDKIFRETNYFLAFFTVIVRNYIISGLLSIPKMGIYIKKKVNNQVTYSLFTYQNATCDIKMPVFL